MMEEGKSDGEKPASGGAQRRKSLKDFKKDQLRNKTNTGGGIGVTVVDKLPAKEIESRKSNEADKLAPGHKSKASDGEEKASGAGKTSPSSSVEKSELASGKITRTAEKPQLSKPQPARRKSLKELRAEQTAAAVDTTNQKIEGSGDDVIVVAKPRRMSSDKADIQDRKEEEREKKEEKSEKKQTESGISLETKSQKPPMGSLTESAEKKNVTGSRKEDIAGSSEEKEFSNKAETGENKLGALKEKTASGRSIRHPKSKELASEPSGVKSDDINKKSDASVERQSNIERTTVEADVQDVAQPTSDRVTQKSDPHNKPLVTRRKSLKEVREEALVAKKKEGKLGKDGESVNLDAKDEMLEKPLEEHEEKSSARDHKNSMLQSNQRKRPEAQSEETKDGAEDKAHLAQRQSLNDVKEEARAKAKQPADNAVSGESVVGQSETAKSATETTDGTTHADDGQNETARTSKAPSSLARKKSLKEVKAAAAAKMKEQQGKMVKEDGIVAVEKDKTGENLSVEGSEEHPPGGSTGTEPAAIARRKSLKELKAEGGANFKQQKNSIETGDSELAGENGKLQESGHASDIGLQPKAGVMETSKERPAMTKRKSLKEVKAEAAAKLKEKTKLPAGGLDTVAVEESDSDTKSTSQKPEGEVVLSEARSEEGNVGANSDESAVPATVSQNATEDSVTNMEKINDDSELLSKASMADAKAAVDTTEPVAEGTATERRQSKISTTSSSSREEAASSSEAEAAVRKKPVAARRKSLKEMREEAQKSGPGIDPNAKEISDAVVATKAKGSAQEGNKDKQPSKGTSATETSRESGKDLDERGIKEATSVDEGSAKKTTKSVTFKPSEDTKTQRRMGEAPGIADETTKRVKIAEDEETLKETVKDPADRSRKPDERKEAIQQGVKPLKQSTQETSDGSQTSGSKEGVAEKEEATKEKNVAVSDKGTIKEKHEIKAQLGPADNSAASKKNQVGKKGTNIENGKKEAVKESSSSEEDEESSDEEQEEEEEATEEDETDVSVDEGSASDDSVTRKARHVSKQEKLSNMFLRFCQRHFYVPLQDKSVKTATETLCLALFIRGVEGWKMLNVPESLTAAIGDSSSDKELTYCIRASLFSANDRTFFGNTLTQLSSGDGRSPGIGSSRQSQTQRRANDVLFDTYYFVFSSIRDSSCVCVIELVACISSPSESSVQNTYGCGWCILPLFQPDKLKDLAEESAPAKMEHVPVFAGSPRELLWTAQKDWSQMELVGGSSLHYVRYLNTSHRPLRGLLNENELYCASDVIPGLMTVPCVLRSSSGRSKGKGKKRRIYLPCIKGSSKKGDKDGVDSITSIQLLPRTSLEMESIIIRVLAREEFENSLMENVILQRTKSSGGLVSTRADITHRVLRIGIHNGKRFVVRPSAIPLKMRAGGSGRVGKGGERDSDYLSSSTKLKIKGIVGDPRFALVLLLQYTVQVIESSAASSGTSALASITGNSSESKSRGERDVPQQEPSVVVVGCNVVVLHDGKVALFPEPNSVLSVKLKDTIWARRFTDAAILSAGGSDHLKRKTDVTFQANITLGSFDGKKEGEGQKVSVEEPTEPRKRRDKIKNEKPESPKRTEKRSLSPVKKKEHREVKSPVNLLQDIDESLERYMRDLPLFQVDGAGDRFALFDGRLSTDHLKYLSRASLALLSRYGLVPNLPTDVSPLKPKVRGSNSLFSEESLWDGHPSGPSSSSRQSQSLSVEEEMLDPLKIHEVTIHFAAFHHNVSASSNPGDIFFTFQFFTCRPTRTERLSLMPSGGSYSTFSSGTASKSGKVGKTSIFIREESQEPGLAIRFRVDTGAVQPDENQLFAEYLYRKTLYIDVWDGKSQFHLGVIAIPLRQLMRQKRKSIKVAAQYEVLPSTALDMGQKDMLSSTLASRPPSHHPSAIPLSSSSTSTSVGSVQIIITNVGIQPFTSKGKDVSTSLCVTDASAADACSSSSLTAWRFGDGPETSSASARLRVLGKPLSSATASSIGLSPERKELTTPAKERKTERDEDNEFSISYEEIEALCQKYHAPMRRSKILYTELLDILENTQVTLEEQINYLLSRLKAVASRQNISKQRMLDVFQRLDPNHTQTVDVKIAKQVLIKSFGFLKHLSTAEQSLCLSPFLEGPNLLNYNRLIDRLWRASSSSSNLKEHDKPEDLPQELISRIQQIFHLAQSKGVSVAELFRHFDRDGDGGVNCEEFVEILKAIPALAVSVSEMQQVFEAIDADKDGSITLREFRIFVYSQKKATIPSSDVSERVAEVFRRALAKGVKLLDLLKHIDSNKSGLVDREEFSRTLLSLPGLDLSAQEANMIFNEIDADRNGLIEIAEFRRYLMRYSDEKGEEIGMMDGKLLDENEEHRVSALLKEILSRAQQKGVSVGDLFGHFDKDGSRQVDLKEFGRVLREELLKDISAASVALADEAVLKGIFDRIDKNKSGYITLKEFSSYLVGQSSVASAESSNKSEKDLAKIREIFQVAKSKGANLQQLFRHFDKDQSNRVDVDEFGQVIQQLPGVDLSKKEIHETFVHIDADKSGKITFEEFEAFVENKEVRKASSSSSSPTPVETLKAILVRAKEQGVQVEELFRHFDIDNSKYVEISEFLKVLQALPQFTATENEVRVIFDLIDKDRSGKITCQEFLTFMEGREREAKTTAVQPEGKKDEEPKDTILDSATKFKAVLQKAITEGGVKPSDLFAHIDKDKSNAVDATELEKVLLSLPGFQPDSVDVKAIFKIIDKDGSGHISVQEFVRFVEEEGLPASDVKETECAATPMASAALPSTAPSPIVAKLKAVLVSAREQGVQLGDLFDHFDKDKSGYLEMTELGQVLAALPNFQLTSEELNELFVGLDKDKSGKISRGELLRFVEGQETKPEVRLTEKTEGIAGERAGQEQSTGQSSTLKQTEGAGLKEANTIVETLRQVLGRARDQGVQIQALFDHFDKDKSNSVDLKEFAGVIRSLPDLKEMSDEDVQLVFETIDKDKNKRITCAEFTSYVGGKHEAREESKESQGKHSALPRENPASSHVQETVQTLRVILKAALAQGVSAKDLFKHFDKNASDNVDVNELTKVLKSLPNFQITDSEAQSLFNSIDVNHNGQISCDEFVSFIVTEEKVEPVQEHSRSAEKAKESTKSQFESDPRPVSVDAIAEKLALILNTAKTKGNLNMKELFLHFDSDKSGAVESHEFQRVLEQLPGFQIHEKEAIALFQAIDTDRNRKISCEEFIAFVEKKGNIVLLETKEASPQPGPASSSSSPLQIFKEKLQELKGLNDGSLTSAFDFVRRFEPLDEGRFSTLANDILLLGLSDRKRLREMFEAVCQSLSSSVSPQEVDGITCKHLTKLLMSKEPSNAAASALAKSLLPIERKLQRAAMRVKERGGPGSRDREKLPAAMLRKIFEQYDLRREGMISYIDILQVLMRMGLYLVEEADRRGRGPTGEDLMVNFSDSVHKRQLGRAEKLKKALGGGRSASPTRSGRKDRVKITEVEDEALSVAQKKEWILRQRQIEHIKWERERAKKSFVASVIKRQITDNVALYPSFGRLLFFEYRLRNPYPVDERFVIKFPDTDLRVVRDAEEWQYYRSHAGKPCSFANNEILRGRDASENVEARAIEGEARGGQRVRFSVFAGPVEKDMISSHLEIMILANGEVSIPFSFLSQNPDFAVPSASFHREHAEGAERGEYTIPVLFVSPVHEQTVALLNVLVRPRPFVVDRNLYFYHPGGELLKKSVEIPSTTSVSSAVASLSSAGSSGSLPVIASDSKTQLSSSVGGPPSSEKFVYCAQKNALMECRERQVLRGYGHDLKQEVFLKCKLESYPSITSFFAILYDDARLTRIYEIWQLHIHSRQKLQLQGSLGSTIATEIVLQGDETFRSVLCHSSRNAETKFHPTGIVRLFPNALNRIEVLFAPKQIGHHIFHINVTDARTRDLVASWIAYAMVLPPNVSKTYDVTAPLMRNSNKKISFINEWDTERTFYLATSDETVVSAKSSVLEMASKEQTFIHLQFIKPENLLGQSEPAPEATRTRREEKALAKLVYLFIKDENDQVEECFQLNITYI